MAAASNSMTEYTMNLGCPTSMSIHTNNSPDAGQLQRSPEAQHERGVLWAGRHLTETLVPERRSSGWPE